MNGRMKSVARKCAFFLDFISKTHPCIHIQTENGAEILSRETYIPADVRIFHCPKPQRLQAKARIRVRGHSTAEQAEDKPYRIRFESKQSLLSLHDGKAYRDWVLLRTYYHLSPDYLALKLARIIFPDGYYCSDCAFVNLYINQRWAGVYLLAEQNQVKEGRMKVYEPRKGETGPEIGYLLKLDNYAGEKHPYFTIPETEAISDLVGTERPLPARDYTILSRIRSDEQYTFISRYLQNAFAVLYEAAVHGTILRIDEQNQLVPGEDVFKNGFQSVEALFDLDSLAEFIILEELVQNYDVGAGGMYIAMDFSPSGRFRKLTFMGPWDFNWTFQENPDLNFYACTFQKRWQDQVDRSNSWFILAAKLEGFIQILKEKWSHLSKSGVILETVDQVQSEFESLTPDLRNDRSKISKEVFICDFVRRRVRWLDSQWLLPGNPCNASEEENQSGNLNAAGD